MGVYHAMRAAGYAAGVMFSAALDSGRPRDRHRDYDAALRRAEDALVNAEDERDVLEPGAGRVFSARDENAIALLKIDPGAYFAITKLQLPEHKYRAAVAEALAERADSRSCDDAPCGPPALCGCFQELSGLEDEAWDANEDFDARRSERTNTWMRDTDSPVEGSGDATGGVPSPPSVVPLSELVDRVADELRAQHQPNWLGDKVRATAAMLKTQGL